MDFEILASRLGVDKDDFIELADLFVVTTLSDMEKIRLGLEKENPTRVAAAAHSIKGAAGNLGFDPMAETALEMETIGKAGVLDGIDELLDALDGQVDTLKNMLAELQGDWE